MSRIARFFKKKILLKYDNTSIEELFVSSFVEQINDFQVHLSSLTIFIYSLINILINVTQEEKDNRTSEIILFSIQLGIALIVLIVGRRIVCTRFILLYVQQIFFVAIHTILILAANEKEVKLYLILVSYCLHILIMPQSQHVYIMLSNIIYFTILMVSFTEFDWKEMWQVWILLGIIGLELRLFVDEKQKRLLFHDESYFEIQPNEQEMNIMNGVDGGHGEQGSPTSSTRYINIKQIGVNIPAGQQFRQLQSHRPTIGNQQTQQHSGNNILINQGSNNPENIETHRQIPMTGQSPQSNQQKQIQLQNSKGGGGGFSSQSVFNHQFSTTKQNSIINNNILNVHQNQQPPKLKNDTIIQSQFKERSHTVNNLKRKMTIFQMRRGMDDLRKLIYSSSMMMNNEGGQIGINSGRVESNHVLNNSFRQEIPYALQISPLISNTYESPINVNSAQIRRSKQNNIYNLMPFSFLYGKLDSQNNESIQLIYANNKAKTEYQIGDTAKFDDFLKKCKISSVLLKSPDPSLNSLKKIIVVNYQQMLEESKSLKQPINSNPSILSPEFKRNGNAHFTVNENQLGIYNTGQRNNRHAQRFSIHGRSSTQNDPKDKQESKGISVLLDLLGRKVVAKIVILPNDEFFIYINDDGFEKFILDKKKRVACDQLINIVDMMINRFQTIQQMLYCDIPASKKEILMETFLATNYAQNIQNSIKEQLQYNIEIINKKIIISDTLSRVKEMVERKFKKVQVLIDEEIPNECKKIYNDPYHLVRTLTNIIENAYNNTKEGFVQILLHQSRIFKDHLRFDIIDSGIGIDPMIVQLINENNFFNDEEEEDIINKLFLLFATIQQKNNNFNVNNNAHGEEKDQDKFLVEDSIIKGFGLKFSHHMIKIIGPYNRMYAESIPGVGSRISFIVYKEGTPSQDAQIKPYQFKNNNFEQEMEYFNPLIKNASNHENCTLGDYISHVLKELNKLEPPSLNNSLLNINLPSETKSFHTPFTVKKSKENNTREIRSTSAHQIKSRHKVSFSNKNISDQQKYMQNLLMNRQLSPLIQGMAITNTAQNKFSNQNSLALSLSPPGGFNQNNLNPLYNQDMNIENISQHFRNINPASSQMYNENIHNNLNTTQLSIQTNYKNPLLNKTSPKDNFQNSNSNFGIFLNMRRNNSNPNNNSNFFVVQDSNLPSAVNSANNSNMNIIPQVLSNNSLTNISNNLVQGTNWGNIQNKGSLKSNNQLQVPSYQEKFLFDLNIDPPSNTQQVINDSYNQQEQGGYFIAKLQQTN